MTVSVLNSGIRLQGLILHPDTGSGSERHIRQIPVEA